MTRITLDGFDLFKAIGTHREVFASAEVKIDKAAQAIVLAHIKASNVSVGSLSGLLSAIGSHYFSIALDHFGSVDLKKVLKKIDPYHSAAALTDVQLRQRIHELAEGRSMPEEKPSVAPKSPKKAKNPVAKRVAEWPPAMSPPSRKAS